MTLNNKDITRQLFLSKIMFFAWLAASIVCLGAGVYDFVKIGTENSLQFFLFFILSAIMAIYRFAVYQKNKKVN
jgi:membrane protein implicated in regulation of membrane protease activity